MRAKGERFDIDEDIIALSLERMVGKRWVVGGTVGHVLDGELAGIGRQWDIQPGLLLGIFAGREWLGANRANVFLSTVVSLTWSVAWLRERGPTYARETFMASDLRADLAFGVTLWGVWSPYVSARAFGGPFGFEVDGESFTGSDPEHHSLAIGSRITLPGGSDLNIDWAFEGARGLTVGVGARF